MDKHIKLLPIFNSSTIKSLSQISEEKLKYQLNKELEEKITEAAYHGLYHIQLGVSDLSEEVLDDIIEHFSSLGFKCDRSYNSHRLTIRWKEEKSYPTIGIN